MKSAFSGGTAGFGFIGDSAAGYFPMAEREYFKLNGIAPNSRPREGQHTQIMRFAAMPIVYFMAWLAEKGGYSEHFMVDEGNGELIENVKNRAADPLELLLSQPNKQLNAADLNDEMLNFAAFITTAAFQTTRRATKAAAGSATFSPTQTCTASRYFAANFRGRVTNV